MHTNRHLPHFSRATFPALLVLLALPVIFLLSTCTESPATPGEAGEDHEPSDEPLPPFLLGGIQVNEADHDRWFANLRDRGMNAVQVTDYAMQGDWDTDHLWWDEESPWVVEEIRGAEEAGLETVFVARVALDHAFEKNAFLWHGMILPRTGEMLDSWFEQYTRFVVQWAEIAEREGVDVFFVGSEMNALATTLPAEEPPALEEYFLNAEKQEKRRREVIGQQEIIERHALEMPEREGFDTVEEYIDARIAVEREWARTATGEEGAESLEEINARRARLDAWWRDLIAAVREVYSGPVGYAANFDQYHQVGFWDALDVMGVNAYFELRSELLPDENELSDEELEERLYPLLVEGWTEVLGGIRDFRQERGLEIPLVFTEMGFTRRAKSTVRPWAHEGFSLIYSPTGEIADDGSRDTEEEVTEEFVVVWQDQPVRPYERALAVRALHAAHGRLDDPFLRGILYWKLSSHDYHLDDESFMVHVGPESEDPVLEELRRFVESE